jgi:DNA-binding XRE family transcriptional regulator/tetratricopeptide (TPR) repeat protein
MRMPQQPRRLNPEASPLARFGARLRAYRNQHGWVQAELGRVVHVSGTLIAKLEKAERRPQPDVAKRLDEALGADGELARLAADALRCPITEPNGIAGPGQGRPGAMPGGNVEQIPSGLGLWTLRISELRRLADLYDVPDDGIVRPVDELARDVEQVIEWRLNSDYERLTGVLPGLLPELTRAMLDDHGREREQVAGFLVQGWRAADAVASKLGLFDLSARLIHVMGWAAGWAGDDGLSLAATSYVRAETFLTNGELQAGHLMLERAAAKLSPGASEHAMAQYGALHMRAALTAGRAGMQAEADGHLDEAWSMAHLVPEGIWEGTAFGPASVRIHEVSTAVDLDRPQVALTTAQDWVPPTTLPAERRSHFYVDLARAQLAVGRYEEVIGSLEAALEIAPQNVRVHPHVRQTLAALASTSPANAAAVGRFAETAAMPVRRTPTALQQVAR